MRSTMTTRAAAIALGLSALPAVAAPGANVSYDHVGLRYIEQDLDDYNCNQDGLSAYGNLDLDGQFFATGELSDLSGDNGCGSTTVRVGGGYRTALNPGMDIYGTLSAERTDPDVGDSDTGLVAAVGVRGYIIDRLEAKAEVAHHTVFDDTTELNVGGYYWLTRAVAATVDASVSDEGESIAVGARMNF